MHSIVWFWTTGIHDATWVQAIAAVALVALTLVTLIVLGIYAWDTRTLAATSKVSAEAAERSSKLASDQIQAMIGKERARIYVVPFRDSFCNVNVSNITKIGEHAFILSNVGPTPAVNVLTAFNAVATAFQTEATGKSNRFSNREVIPANQESVVNFPIETGLAADQRVPDAFYIHIWGEVTYNDVISSTSRSTKFRFRIPMQQTRGDGSATQNGNWIRCGSEEDHKAT